ncbi:MAG TPA: kinase/pyrophosphorylase [Gammaproteobacteria bacterium]|nr:kinase/pyrophosphorylase [Gammaproteobacteria bacterium]
MPQRELFLISDSTAITVETLARSLLSQFPDVGFNTHILRYVNTEARAREAAAAIELAAAAGNGRVLVFTTLMDDALRKLLANTDCLHIDFMHTFITPLEKELGTRCRPRIGQTHGLGEDHHLDNAYLQRMEAVNFALRNDDGASTAHYDEAELILIGVSRSGKTPTSLYLAMHYGIMVANYPLVEEDLEELTLPEVLRPHRARLYGLRIDPLRLHELRRHRQPGSRYASLRQCEYETRQVEALYRRVGVPSLDVTSLSVEEIATRLLEALSANTAGS